MSRLKVMDVGESGDITWELGLSRFVNLLLPSIQNNLSSFRYARKSTGLRRCPGAKFRDFFLKENGIFDASCCIPRSKSVVLFFLGSKK